MTRLKTRMACLAAAAAATCLNVVQLQAEAIRGQVVDESGESLEGVMVSAFDHDRQQSTSVFSQADGSFVIDGLRDTTFELRARLTGRGDEWQEDVDAGATDVAFTMEPATGEALELQRPANSGFSMLEWDNMRDKENFKMMCMYCHQVGTLGFRTPEKPVDWETMLRRMDGFGGLYRHTQETIVQRLVDTYADDAVNSWPEFVPPPAPEGAATQARITEWDMGEQFKAMIHDIEPGPDGLMYAVDMAQNAVVTLDPETGERELYRFPGQKYHGPHSIELGNDGKMWFTLCASGEMASFDIETKEFNIVSSAEAPAPRGAYPHTLRINPRDPEGLIWYTDAGTNSCFSLHPETFEVKEYEGLRAEQAVSAGRGESRGITPYGIDVSPVDGTIWYSKLNGNRIGRIDPTADDGDIREWNPPFRGPRRLHVAPDGIVWVPGFGSGVFGKFDPQTEEWTVYDLPDAENQIPYALNIDPEGFVWICGTGNDTLNRFDPRTEELVVYRMPSRVTYTREIEFDADGNVWTCNSNGPARHTERGFGSIIKLEIVGETSSGGIQLAGRHFDGDHDYGHPVAAPADSPLADLLARIDSNDLPDGYDLSRGQTDEEKSRIHQDYVDRRMEGLTDQQRGRIGQLWQEKVRIDPDMPNRGASFVRIMEFVATGGESRDTSSTRPAASESPAATAADDPPGLSGIARFDGRPPERRPVSLREKGGKLSDCHELHDGVLLDENVIVSEAGEIANVFVYVKRGLPDVEHPVPEEPALLDQKKCMFTPRVQGVRVGQQFLMRNSDPVLHNVRSLSFRNRAFNFAQPADSEDRDRTFTIREKAIRVQCDIHPWMRAYYFVMDHPFFAVTDETGRFNIEGLPPGEYTLAAWHEEFGEEEAELTVGEDGIATVSFTFRDDGDE